MLRISRSVGESKEKLFYFTLKDNYQRNVHTRGSLVICTARRCRTLSCVQTAVGGAGRQVTLWPSTGFCPSLSRNVWVYMMWQRPIWGRNTKRCIPGLAAKPADSLSGPPHFSPSLMLSLSWLLILPISLAFSYCLGRDLPVRHKGCCLLYLRSTMRTILFKSTSIGQFCLSQFISLKLRAELHLTSVSTKQRYCWDVKHFC